MIWGRTRSWPHLALATAQFMLRMVVWEGGGGISLKTLQIVCRAKNPLIASHGCLDSHPEAAVNCSPPLTLTLTPTNNKLC